MQSEQVKKVFCLLMDLELWVFIDTVTVSATCLIRFMGANHDEWILIVSGFAIHQALRIMRILTT